MLSSLPGLASPPMIQLHLMASPQLWLPAKFFRCVGFCKLMALTLVFPGDIHLSGLQAPAIARLRALGLGHSGGGPYAHHTGWPPPSRPVSPLPVLHGHRGGPCSGQALGRKSQPPRHPLQAPGLEERCPDTLRGKKPNFPPPSGRDRRNGSSLYHLLFIYLWRRGWGHAEMGSICGVTSQHLSLQDLLLLLGVNHWQFSLFHVPTYSLGRWVCDLQRVRWGLCRCQDQARDLGNKKIVLP